MPDVARLERTGGEATDASWQALARLWQCFSHDLSGFRGNLPAADGLFWSGRERWRGYVADPDRCGYLVRIGDAPVGFALVRGLGREPRILASYFVVRAVRGTGIGTAMLGELFARHPGRWEVAFQDENVAGARFWRRVVPDLLADVGEEGRPVPGREDLPEDRWIHGRTPGSWSVT